MKGKRHTVYKLKNGQRVPGTTTITGTQLGWNKQFLIDWSNKLGLDGFEQRKFVDDKAEIGTLGHQFILDGFRVVTTDTSDYSEKQIESAKNSYQSYVAWAKGKVIKPIIVEEPLVSEEYMFGGTPDFYGEVDGELEIIDYKTGKSIYSDYSVQVAGGYLILLEEMKRKVDRIRILNIPRSSGESFQQLIIPQTQWGTCKKIFLNCLENYYLQRDLERG